MTAKDNDAIDICVGLIIILFLGLGILTAWVAMKAETTTTTATEQVEVLAVQEAIPTTVTNQNSFMQETAYRTSYAIIVKTQDESTFRFKVAESVYNRLCWDDNARTMTAEVTRGYDKDEKLIHIKIIINGIELEDWYNDDL